MHDTAGAGFGLVFEHAREAITVSLADGTLVAVNRCARELLGYGQGELDGRPVAGLVRPMDLGALALEAEALAATGSARGEWLMVRKDGALVEVERLSERLPDGRVCTVVRDLTERRRDQRELRATDERMRATIDGRPDVAVQWYDLRGRVLLWNRASQRMFGFAAEEALGKRLVDLIYTAEQQAEFDACLRGIASTGEHVGPVELSFKRRDGSSGTCLSTIFAIPGEGGDPYFVCMDVDLTEHKRVEAELREAQKDEVLVRLAGGMAHDFNNLLTAIVGFAELGAGRVAPGSEPAECFGFILQSAQRGAALTGNLLAFARRRLGATRTVVLSEVVDRLLPLLGPLLGGHIAMTVEHTPGTDAVTIDVGAIEQLVMNLVINARDAMPGGGTLRIATRPVADGESGAGRWTRLEVHDSGPGLSEEAQARVFEPFFAPRALGSGSGLGLATCAGIVRQAGGQIGVTSGSGGTTFWIHLPAAVTPAEAAKPRPQREGARGDETILVVEDEPAVRLLVERVLKQLGYRVLAASDGREALAVAARHDGPIDLLLSDLIMPEMGGLELARALAVVRPDTRVLLCTGYSDDPALVASQHALLTKPYTPSLLARRVREAIDTPR